MSRRVHSIWAILTSAMIACTGCHPQQPFYFHEDGDLSHYMDVATAVEYPDVNAPSLDEVQATKAPLTLVNAENFQIWDLTLQEVTRITLANSDVIRSLGGRVSDAGQNIATSTPETLSQNAANATTTKDPAGNRKLDKSRATGRIDGMQALAMAMGIAQTADAPSEDPYANRGLILI